MVVLNSIVRLYLAVFCGCIWQYFVVIFGRPTFQWAPYLPVCLERLGLLRCYRYSITSDNTPNSKTIKKISNEQLVNFMWP